MEEQMMSDTKRDYAIGYGKPPKGRPFRKGQSGNPRGPGGKTGLAAMLAVALDERVTITINGRRRRMTKREAIVAQMVDKSTSADLRAIKMLIDMQKDAEAKTGTAPPEPAPEPTTLNDVIEAVDDALTVSDPTGAKLEPIVALSTNARTTCSRMTPSITT